MTTLSLNEKFNIQFIAHLKDYEADLILLRRLGFDTTCEDLNKENCPINYPLAEGRPEVIFNIANVSLKDAAFIQTALNRSK